MNELVRVSYRIRNEVFDCNEEEWCHNCLLNHVFCFYGRHSVFSSGGIGGVHKHGEQTMDVSSDLTELGKTQVAVVSAGVKSIPDIGRTLEYLETQGFMLPLMVQMSSQPSLQKTSGFRAPSLIVEASTEALVLADALLRSNLIYVFIFGWSQKWESGFVKSLTRVSSH